MIKNIVLDYGHGGIDDAGNYTTAPAKMYTFPDGVVAYEGVLNRRIGGLLEVFLQSTGLNIVPTVTMNDPRDLALSWRVRKANALPKNETLFISIHNNAFNTQVSGFEIYTHPGQSLSDQLATDIFRSVEPFLGAQNIRMRTDFRDGDPDKESKFYVLRKTACPAVLVECLFFDHRPDFDKLIDPAFQKEMAWWMFEGIRVFLER